MGRFIAIFAEMFYGNLEVSRLHHEAVDVPYLTQASETSILLETEIEVGRSMRCCQVQGDVLWLSM